jgi:hypothetical protein
MAKKAEQMLSDFEMEQVARNTLEELKAQPKRQIRLHLSPEEKRRLEAAEANGNKVEWPFQYVGINGVNYQIQLGKEVEVPESVYEILNQAGLA